MKLTLARFFFFAALGLGLGFFASAVIAPPPPRASISLLPPAVSLVWLSSSSNAFYNVYWGTSSHSYDHQIPVGTNLTSVIAGLELGRTYYFTVSAYDPSVACSESDLSPETKATVFSEVQVKFIGALQSSTDLVNWQTVSNATNGTLRLRLDNSKPMEFFRINF